MTTPILRRSEVELLARSAYETLVHEPDAEKARRLAKDILSHITRQPRMDGAMTRWLAWNHPWLARWVHPQYR